jgi:nucleotide-binding universal stress UspA family protein
MNLAIIGEAERLTKTFGGELTLMAAWELYGEQTMRRSAFLHTPIEHYHDLFDLREQITTRGLTELAQAAKPSVDYKIVIENGIAVPTILEVIRKRRANMLVIGTVGRAGLTGLLLGNTAEHLADAAECSVYAVKPPGFTSPLR